MTQAALMECPTCKTPTSQATLGMRDYSRWLKNVLPGKIGLADVDGVLQQESTGRMLMLEFKEANKRLGIGQRLLLRALKRKGIDVWVIWEYPSKGVVRAGAMDEQGEVHFLEELTEAELGAKVEAWWWAGFEQKSAA